MVEKERKYKELTLIGYTDITELFFKNATIRGWTDELAVENPDGKSILFSVFSFYFFGFSSSTDPFINDSDAPKRFLTSQGIYGKRLQFPTKW